MSNRGAAIGVVRPLAAADLEAVLAWRNHESVRAHMYTRHEISREEHHAWFERSRDDPARHPLVYESAGVALGFVNFTERRPAGRPSGVADWGFYSAPGAPRGTGRRLCRAGLAYAFERLALHKICGEALAANAASIRLHQALGFVLEGILREQHFDGERHHDVHCFGLLRREWRAARTEHDHHA